jgi:hypothetical protein
MAQMNDLEGSIQLPRQHTKINLHSLGPGAYSTVLRYLQDFWRDQINLVPESAPPGIGEPLVGQGVASYAYITVNGVRYGAANRYRGVRYKYAYVYSRQPVRVAWILHVNHSRLHHELPHLVHTLVAIQRFLPPKNEPKFPWSSR